MANSCDREYSRGGARLSGAQAPLIRIGASLKQNAHEAIMHHPPFHALSKSLVNANLMQFQNSLSHLSLGGPTSPALWVVALLPRVPLLKHLLPVDAHHRRLQKN